MTKMQIIGFILMMPLIIAVLVVTLFLLLIPVYTLIKYGFSPERVVILVIEMGIVGAGILAHSKL